MEDLILNERQFFTTGRTLRLRSGQASGHSGRHRGNHHSHCLNQFGYAILSRALSRALWEDSVQGEFFGFASMLEETVHQSGAIALEDTVCIEVDRHDIAVLLQRKPMAGMDMLAVLGRQFHSSQKLVRVRAARNPNEVIEEKETLGERVADHVASFGGACTVAQTFRDARSLVL